MLKISATQFATLCLLLLIAAALSPASTAQTTQTTTTPPLPTIMIPTGSYMTSCNTCQFEGTYYSCKCKAYGFESNVPYYTATKIDLSTCTVDSSGFYNLTYTVSKSSNTAGTLNCSTS